MASKKPVPPPNPRADSVSGPTHGSHSGRVRGVIAHGERHGETAHHDHPEARNVDHGFGNLPSGHGGGHEEY